MPRDLTENVVEADTYQVSPEPVLLVAELFGAMALCLHDESRGVGGLLHLRFAGDGGRPSDVTDNTLSSVLTVLDRFKRAVIGASARRDRIHARILAHAPPPGDLEEPTASLVDLVLADFADGRIDCGRRLIRRIEPLRVCFEPFSGRAWVSGPHESAPAAARRA